MKIRLNDDECIAFSDGKKMNLMGMGSKFMIGCET